MSRLADYFVVVGYDYNKECMCRAFLDPNLLSDIISVAKYTGLWVKQKHGDMYRARIRVHGI